MIMTSPLCRPRSSSKLLPVPFVALLLLVCQCATCVSSQHNSTISTGCASPPCRKILCLHGGGETGPAFKDQPSMVDIVSRAGASYEFVFLTAPYGSTSSALWIRDPPNGKGTHTTDPAAGWDAQSLAAID